MTEAELAAVIRGIAPIVREQIATAVSGLGPVLERLAAVEARLVGLAELTKDVGSLRERTAVLETRPLVPGPPGDAGPPGQDGVHGKDGTAGLTYVGVYQDGKSYEPGELATWGGSMWHANVPTTTKPGDGSKDWTLACKRGRDGKDGIDAPGALPVLKVGGSR